MNMFSSIDVIVQGEMRLPEQIERRGFASLTPGAHRRHSEIEIVVYRVDDNQPG
jgi:hypothetical protein